MPFCQVQKIKGERGARVGRYIIASTSAKFNEPLNIYDIPCDFVFCLTNAGSYQLTEAHVAKLADNGCHGEHSLYGVKVDYLI
jgi:glutamate dehydrogenase (NADP+)